MEECCALEFYVTLHAKMTHGYCGFLKASCQASSSVGRSPLFGEVVRSDAN